MELRLDAKEMSEAIGEYVVNKGLVRKEHFVVHFKAIRHRKEADEFFAVIEPLAAPTE